jgi:hypothetical protein
MTIHFLAFATVSNRNKFLMFEGDFLVRIKGNILIRYFAKSNRIKNYVEIISGGYFRECKSLHEVVFESGSNLKEIGDSAFSYSGIKTIRIQSSVENIENEYFYECKSLSEVMFEGFRTQV